MIFSSACLEEIEDISKGRVSTGNLEINPSVSLPLIDTRIDISDISGSLDSLGLEMSEGDFGTVVLKYSQSVFSGVAEDYFNVEDQSSPNILITGIDSQNLSGSGEYQFSEEGTVIVGDLGTEKLDSLLLKGGNIIVHIFNSFDADVTATFSIPELEFDNTPYTESFNLVNGENTRSRSLDNGMFDFTQGGTEDNQLSYKIEGTIYFDNTVITPDQRLEVYFEIVDPGFKGIYGESIDRELLNQQGSQDVNFFQNNTLDGFTIQEPSLSVTLENSFGVTLMTDINEISIVDKNDNVVSLSGSFLDDNNPFSLQGPGLNEIGESVTTTYTVSHENSNLNELISLVPKRFVYDARGYVEAGQNLFVLDTSKVNVTAEVVLPLFGSINNLAYEETFDFDGSVFNNIDLAKFTFTIDNKFPFQANIELYFLNDQDVILDSFFNDDPELFAASPVDVNGVSTEVQTKVITLDLTRERLQILESATKINLVLHLSTSEGGTVPVRITWNDYINIQAGMEGRANL